MTIKTAQKHTIRQLLSTIAITSSFIFLSTSLSHANSRTEVKDALEQLQSAGTAQKKPDDMRSIEATFSIAEQYLQQDNPEIADRFYLLTLQKIRILKSSIINPEPESGNVPPMQPANGSPALDATHTPNPVMPPVEAETTIDPKIPAIDKVDTPHPNTDISSTELINDLSREEISSDRLVGRASSYIVVKNDNLRLIAAKLGVSKNHLIQINKLDPKALLKIGQKLSYNNRKIVPQRMRNGIVINIPDRTLYYFTNGKLDLTLPVALGVPIKNEKYDWTTPTGKFKIIAKQKDPTWFVPPSIQSEMEEGGKDVVTSMPPGPTNPLGKYAMKTSLPGILIHSTTKPGSIYSFASHGCIRVYPEQMEEFFKKIRVNTQGEIIYRPVKLAITENGRVFLEVHQDAYKKSSGLSAMAKQMIEKQNLSKRVDWTKVESVINHKAGLAEDISL